MKAATYVAPGQLELIDQPKPEILAPTDAVVRLLKTTICGTDLHILGGDVPETTHGTILGHEGIGIVESVGSAVNNFKVGDKVIISCITACNTCYYCKKGIPAHCESGGWILGHLINGTQAEYVHIPQADGSLYHAPKTVEDDALVMLSDIFPTSYEIGVQSAKVKPGDTVCIVGAGPIGLAALLTAQFYSPAKLIMVDLSESRLEAAKRFGATDTICSDDLDDIVKKVHELTDGRGVDVAIECVGYPATFDICQKIVAIGGHVSNVGVHGKPVSLDLQDLWIKNITMSTGLVNANTTEMLLNVLKSGKIDATKMVTHHFKLSEVEKAYEVFKNAGSNNALKVIIENDITA
ncbi:TPA: zinc-dependent alcohol dehydrogenase family protein [Streptococcus equi subsp. zooepidemicus]|uniref:Zinc-binding alcohol dehydrogenase n=1 Tax=Streptococcus equi subsp. zooepidemicus TaxID=40041 RepID=A0A7Z9D3R0_STRSZ|nr:zinc-dependent alcohol dehydrogenase family protein [Streptococcus equi]MCD3395422.1 zinc-dependent alcohol dehydrogenase family protein [Streptococcus equi subsp. zooepidemicus]MCD3401902.1 zinc-dependent alcohol dehydrogenase family protein [Streptococcus equi subsp. zooepidemicus]MCD3409113.1 zinc-dependent alcohol dehydrogenase family protein [Streptococcus equi subsp. zooepidemicus]MCD3445696.1 zinc-dependent alcohol dehydrogenase family protein [Streptococcus equi subsp. zooepidemicus]